MCAACAQAPVEVRQTDVVFLNKNYILCLGRQNEKLTLLCL